MRSFTAIIWSSWGDQSASTRRMIGECVPCGTVPSYNDCAGGLGRSPRSRQIVRAGSVNVFATGRTVTMRCPRIGRWERVLGSTVAAFALVMLLPVTGEAQFNGDPFDPYRAAFRSSSMPTANNFGPGQARSFTPPGMGSVPGIGLPFDNGGFNRPVAPMPSSRFDQFDRDLLSPSNDVYRRYDADFNRVYRPNAEADAQFAEAQEARRELYMAASRETDPQKRAELIQQYQTLSRRIGLGLSANTSRSAGSGAEGSSSRSRQGTSAPAPDALPRTVGSFDDLERWSRVVNRRALAAGVVRSEAN